MHPTDPHLIARATGLWEHGRRAQSLELLKERVRAHPTDEAARRRLAEQYREMIAPDQAGRWGVTIPGWATPTELDRLARLLGHADVRGADLPEFLALPSDDLPAAVVDLLPAVEGYRAHFADPARMSRRERKSAAAVSTMRVIDEDSTVFAFWFVSGAIFAVGVLVIWAGTLLGASMTVFARWAAVVSLVVIVPRYAIVAVQRLRRRRFRAAAAPIIGTAALTLAVVRLTAIGLANGGSIVFPWEH